MTVRLQLAVMLWPDQASKLAYTNVRKTLFRLKSLPWADHMDPAGAIELSARLVEADPLDEAAVRANMTWLAKAGQGMRSRQAYREFADRHFQPRSSSLPAA